MNLPPQAPLGTPTALTFESIPHSLGVLQRVALEARPEVQRARNRIEAAKARVQLARRVASFGPSFSVKAGRYNDTGQAVSEVDAGISIGLPFLNARKYSAGITEAQRNLEAAEQEFEAARNEALGLVRDQIEKIEAAAHHYELCRDKILPLASQTLKSHRAAYEASSSNFSRIDRALSASCRTSSPRPSIIWLTTRSDWRSSTPSSALATRPHGKIPVERNVQNENSFAHIDPLFGDWLIARRVPSGVLKTRRRGRREAATSITGRARCILPCMPRIPASARSAR